MNGFSRTVLVDVLVKIQFACTLTPSNKCLVLWSMILEQHTVFDVSEQMTNQVDLKASPHRLAAITQWLLWLRWNIGGSTTALFIVMSESTLCACKFHDLCLQALISDFKYLVSFL
jgi:hypothetical protein